MKLLRSLALSLPLFLAPSLLHLSDASACGGCLVNQVETTQVTGHRMVLSISNDRTTLWDQITYSGAPESFAWVLPTKGTVEVGLSSDALFGTLEQATQVTIASPSLNCLPPGCPFPPNAGGGDGTGTGGGVVVLAEQVVGPYQTVQLSSQDPNALANWLLDNGYNLPPDIAPVVSAYVSEGFNFLALKLVPGQGVSSMRPVRVTGAGASPSLPLRMVAAGTGATTPITLWVLGEGRYEPKNFSSFEIKGSDLTWNWDTQSSDYKQKKQAGFDATNGKSWLVEAGEPFSRWSIQSSLEWSAEFDTANSGYGDDPVTALEACKADLDKLFGTLADNALWVTRLHAELSRAALATDLTLGAADNQTSVERYLQVTSTVGTPPACPPPPDFCNGDPTGSSSSSSGGNPFDPFGGNQGSTSQSSSGCAVSGEAGAPWALFIVGSALLLSTTRRRRR